MHGTLLQGYKQFVVAHVQDQGWQAIADAAGVEGWYFATRIYEDDQLTALLEATAKQWQRPVSVILEEFGAAVVPTLMTVYQAFLDRDWNTFALLMNVETVVHRVVQMRDPGAAPPRLRPTRVSAEEVHIEYGSGRRLCDFAVGICRGVAKHYGDAVTVEHARCMKNGSASCLIVVRGDHVTPANRAGFGTPRL